MKEFKFNATKRKLGKPKFFFDDLLLCCKFYTSHGHSLFGDMEEEDLILN